MLVPAPMQHRPGQSVAVSEKFQSGQRSQQAKKSETSAVWLVEVIGGFRICQKMLISKPQPSLLDRHWSSTSCKWGFEHDHSMQSSLATWINIIHVGCEPHLGMWVAVPAAKLQSQGAPNKLLRSSNFSVFGFPLDSCSGQTWPNHRSTWSTQWNAKKGWFSGVHLKYVCWKQCWR